MIFKLLWLSSNSIFYNVCLPGIRRDDHRNGNLCNSKLQTHPFDTLQIRGSQPFGTCVPPNKYYTPLRTPKSGLFPICVPPNQKFYQNELFLNSSLMLCTLCEHFLSVFFLFCVPPELLTYPRLRTFAINDWLNKHNNCCTIK